MPGNVKVTVVLAEVQPDTCRSSCSEMGSSSARPVAGLFVFCTREQDNLHGTD